jgi:hypothetical protein
LEGADFFKMKKEIMIKEKEEAEVVEEVLKVNCKNQRKNSMRKEVMMKVISNMMKMLRKIE